MPGKNTALTRYSSLDEINAQNVKNLKVAFSFSLGVNRGQEAAPLVVGDTLYVVAPYPNTLFALDLTQPGAPLKWRYDPKPAKSAQGVACCDVVNRGAVYSDGKLYFNTLDGNTIAVDAASGKEMWRTKLADFQKGETITMAPLVAKDKIIVGNSGGEMGVRGWAIALDKTSGKVLWKAFNTGPDFEVLIGSEFKPFFDQYNGKDLGVASWPPDMWRQGGGTVWGWVSYDPDLNLIYYGTSNPGPWNSSMRPGDNLWTAGIFARDADTGQARWFYQYSPHDMSDYDGVNENILIDINWKGQPRKALVHPDRNGYIYLLDRETGELLSAEPYHHITSSKGVDLKSGRLIYNKEKEPTQEHFVKDICPAPPGAKDWQPSAFSHKTGHLYIPHNNLCMDIKETSVGYICRHALRRRRGADEGGTWRKPRRVPGVGRDRRQGALVDQGEVPGLERCRRYRRRRGLLRNDGRLVQGGQRQHGRAAVAVQDLVRNHRPADDVAGARRQTICRRSLGCRRLGRCDRCRWPRQARRHGRARLRQRHEGSCPRTRPREAPSMCSPCLRLGWLCALLCAARGRAGARIARVRRSKQPAVFQAATARDLKTRLRRCWPTSWAPSLAIPGMRNGAAFCAKRSMPASATW